MPGHVEIVDGHLAKYAAPGGERLFRLRLRIAAGDDDLLHRADLAVVQTPFQRPETRVEAAVEADLEDHTGLGHGSEAGVRPVDVEVDRLLAEDRFSASRGAHREVGMGPRCGRDDDSVEGRVVERRPGVDHLRAGHRRDALGRLLPRIHNVPEADLWMAGEVSGMDGADQAGAEQTNVDHLIPSRPETLG